MLYVCNINKENVVILVGEVENIEGVWVEERNYVNVMIVFEVFKKNL